MMPENLPTNAKQATCPNCKRQFHFDPASEPACMPFCCERCQWIDLGRWVDGAYRISKSILGSDDEQID